MVDKCEKAMKQFSATKTVQSIGKQFVIKYFRSIYDVYTSYCINTKILFSRRFAPRCSGCDETFHPTDLVRKARDHYFHVNCFTCYVCRRELHTGDQLLICGNNAFICKQDYLTGNYGSLIGNTIINVILLQNYFLKYTGLKRAIAWFSFIL